MPNGKITIDDIAKALGISKTTVSRAISGKGRVGDDTKIKVLDYIEKYNYTPNVVARALAGQRTFNIGVVWPDDYNAVDLPFFQRCMIGMSEVTCNYGYDIVVTLITGDDYSTLKRVIDNHKVDGIVLTRTLVDDKPSKFLKEAGVPFVAVGTTTDPDVITVDNDNYEACKELTSILIAKGLKRLALIGGSTEHIITNTRYKAFMAAFEENGLTVDNSLICLDTEKPQKIGNALMDLMKKDIDGVVCMDDNVANAVMAKCREEHIKIPDDLKIASFYNSSILENAVPSVTSLNFDERNLGAVAARMLLELIDGEKVASRTLKNYEVILKESTK